MDATSGSREQVLTEERQAQPRPKPTQHRPAELQPELRKLRSTKGVPQCGVQPESRPIPKSRPRSSHAFGSPGLSGVFARRTRGSLQVSWLTPALAAHSNSRVASYAQAHGSVVRSARPF